MRRGSFQYDRARDVLTFLLPSFAGFFLFILLPVIASIALSFTNYTGGKRMSFIGLQNYLIALHSANFWRAMSITISFVFSSVFFQLALGLLFAVILNQRIKGRNFFRGVIFLPVVLSTVAVALAFMLIFHPLKGPANNFLISLGFDPLPWLTSPKTALFTIIIMTIWQGFGYYMVLFLSGLQTINPSLYEAAEIDGAGGLQKFRHVTLPMLKPGDVSLHYFGGDQSLSGLRSDFCLNRRTGWRRAGGLDDDLSV